MEQVANLAYIAAAILFIFGIKMLSRPETARRGNMVSALGMLVAVVTTLLLGGLDYSWILLGLVVGAGVGATAARRVQMTAMPEMVALFNGSGGVASLLVAWAEYHGRLDAPAFTATAIFLAVLIGGVTFAGSLVAFGKLSERIDGRPTMFKGQHLLNGALLAIVLVLAALFILSPATSYPIFIVAILVALALGILAVIPIGGADMPIVISLLNSFSGLAASAAGFIIENNVLIVAGSLVGASGMILTIIMCRAMNRSLANVLFSGFGAKVAAPGAAATGQVQPITPENAYFILEAASRVIFVPGYGMAVAQAQHAVRELAELLEANGVEVSYVIHPVAGRMPGHMNVLLAEANVPYEQLAEPEDVNPTMSTVDVAVVIGANDVVNPDARDNPASPLYGMPIINVDEARTAFVLKRSMNPGFAGVDNPLFLKPNTRMIFGDAKNTLNALLSEYKEAQAA